MEVLTIRKPLNGKTCIIYLDLSYQMGRWPKQTIKNKAKHQQAKYATQTRKDNNHKANIKHVKHSKHRSFIFALWLLSLNGQHQLP